MNRPILSTILLSLFAVSRFLVTEPAYAQDPCAYLLNHKSCGEMDRKTDDYQRCCVKGDVDSVISHKFELLRSPDVKMIHEILQPGLDSKGKICEKIRKLASCEKLKSADTAGITFSACCSGADQKGAKPVFESLKPYTANFSVRELSGLREYVKTEDPETLLEEKVASRLKASKLICFEFEDENQFPSREAYCKNKKVGNLNLTQSFAKCGVIKKTSAISVRAMVTCTPGECLAGADACRVNKLGEGDLKAMISNLCGTAPGSGSTKSTHSTGAGTAN